MRRAHPHASGHLPPMQFISAVWCTRGELACAVARYSAPRATATLTFARIHLSAPHTPPSSMHRNPQHARTVQSPCSLPLRAVRARLDPSSYSYSTHPSSCYSAAQGREGEREGERASTRTLGERRLSHAVVLRLFRRRRRRCPTWSMPHRRASTREQRSESLERVGWPCGEDLRERRRDTLVDLMELEVRAAAHLLPRALHASLDVWPQYVRGEDEDEEEEEEGAGRGGLWR